MSIASEVCEHFERVSLTLRLARIFFIARRNRRDIGPLAFSFCAPANTARFPTCFLLSPSRCFCVSSYLRASTAAESIAGDDLVCSGLHECVLPAKRSAELLQKREGRKSGRKRPLRHVSHCELTCACSRLRCSAAPHLPFPSLVLAFIACSPWLPPD